MMYDNLSDFVAKTTVVRQENVAHIVVDRIMNRDIRLYKFETQSAGRTDFDIQEEGFEYLQALTEKINAAKRG